MLIVPLTLPSWEEVSEPLEKILRETIIARVDFESITLEEALRAIHRQVLEAADPGLFPGPRPQLVIDEEILEPTTEITLRLMNVPASEALRYVTQLGNCSYHVEGATIRVLPLPSKKSPAGP